jgi:hypothetical protein
LAGKWKRRSDSNPLAPLAATRAEHTTAAPGAHANPESMGFLALAVVGLKRSLHDLSFPQISSASQYRSST